MEEASEAHMETDVSSTTEDVSEAQEVTGSNGNVEMIVIVEKVSEEEGQASQQSDLQSPVASSEGDTTTKLSPHTTPTKTQNVSDSPSKESKSPKASSKPQLAESPNKSSQQVQAGEVSVSLDPSESVVDSSSKIEIQEEPDKTSTNSDSSPAKSNEANVDFKTSNNTSPTKVSTSPVNIQLQQATETSPIKETQSQEPVKLTSDLPELAVNTTLNGTVENIEKPQDDISEKSVSSQMEVDKEATNESMSETHSEASEKEHNKSISRELKSLIKSAKESKIISECTQLTSKTRKSRAPLDTPTSSLNVSVEADKINDKRRNSDISQKSNSSEKSDKVAVKRSMRSQNPEFVNKVKQFLNSVTSKVQKESDEGTDEEIEETKSKEHKVNQVFSSPKKKKVAENIVLEKTSKLRSDPYCWRCHWAVEQAPNEKTHAPMDCTVCPRVYHYKCLNGGERNKINTEKSWVCPECMGVLHAESSETRSPAMKKISVVKLRELLNYAMERMVDLNGIEPFLQPVDRTLFPDYDKYVVHPMDLTVIKENIASGHYGSTEAFVADAQWILHNSIIFNTLQSKLTAAARQLVRSCRAEMGEIEACPECYAAAHARRPTWFTDVCTTPHILLWAKLKGFPYWPAKGMSVNNSGLVDVRFFGAHDRAWVPAKDCFLFSEKDPNNFRTKRQDILDSMQEAEQHIRNISRKYGKFVYPPFKTQFDPTKLNEQLKMMIPSFEGEVPRPPLKDKPPAASPSVKGKSRSNSKSSKGSHNGDTSESEEPSADTVASRKMADGAEIAREEEESSDDKDKTDKTMEVNSPVPPPKEVVSRKRRRSEMEEAVITIIDSIKEKKRKSVESKPDEAKSSISQEEAKKEETTTKENPDKSQNKDNEPSSSTNEKDKLVPSLTPIKLVISTKAHKSVVITKSTSKTGKVTPIKLRQLRIGEGLTVNKEKNKADKAKPKEDKKAQKRRNSKTNKSLNNSNAADTSKTEKISEKKGEEKSSTPVVKTKEAESAKENKEDKSVPNKASSKVQVASPKSVKERIQFDDDTSLAVIARKSKTNNNMTGMPTISCVRSLSTSAQKTSTTPTATTTSTNSKTVEITIDTNSDLRLQTNKEQSLVGRVGVRAFARMTSPEPQKKKTDTPNKDMIVEIKAEPMDLDDPERHMEKMDLMTAFRLQPVNTTTTSNLREVRINKVVVPSVAAKKGVGKTTEVQVRPKTTEVQVRPRARKTFPQPKKADDGRSELNSKNSMVYIPIQPPSTPSPMRGSRIAQVSASNGPSNVSRATTVTSCSNNVVNTVTTPLVPSLPPPAPVISTSSLPPTSTTITQLPTVGPLPTVGSLPNVGPLPTNVHTVPLITSVNGQWTFSLQPIMSVGGVDVLIQDDPSPIMNGLPDRSNAPASIVPIVQTPVGSNPNSLLIPSSGPMMPASGTMIPSSGPMMPSSGPMMPSSGHMMPSSKPKALPTSGLQLAPVTTTPAGPNIVISPVVTPNRTTDNVAPGEPPRLQQRPSLVNPLEAPAGVIPTPSSAGPLTAKLNQNAVKLADFFRNLLEDSLEIVDEPVAEVALLKLRQEQTHWRYRQEIEELKHNHELTVAEMRSSFEKEKARIMSEVRLAAQADLESAVKAAKAKQWCANCSQEAQFYCCWNTSYCDYPCQRAHWSQHFAVCTQQRTQDGESSGDAMNVPPESRLQPQPDNIPKNTSAPAATPMLTVGGKVAQPKSGSIIINLEKDANGNPKLKCLGTYKPSTSQPQTQSQPQTSSIVLNKQQLVNPEEGKKVVTSGGYLIVGASNSSSNVVTPPRRTHTIQYFT